MHLAVTLCTQVGTDINTRRTILLSSHSNLQHLALDHVSLDRDSMLLRIVFKPIRRKLLTSVWKNKKELKVFHLSDFYQSITCMMMWDHWNYCYFISQKMHIDLNKYDFEQKNEFNVIHIHHLSITNLEWHCKNGLNTSQNRL